MKYRKKYKIIMFRESTHLPKANKMKKNKKTNMTKFNLHSQIKCQINKIM